jgi:D-alanyl-D-alanine carboxypeptidase
MRRALLVALLLAVPLGAVALATVTRRDDRPSSLEAAADELVAKGVPGVLVRLRDGDDVNELARGTAAPRERFRVGSVTKSFVAVLTVRLADRGVLSLDDPVSRYVPGLLRDGGRVTVRRLLDHTAGLYDYTLDRDLLDGDLSPRALVAIADRRPRSPGYAYSSTNYLALGLVLEAAAGAPLGELLRREVFEPYGLGDTTFEPGVVPGDYLHGNARASRDGIATGRFHDTGSRTARSAWAAAAAVSTAPDLDRFFTRLLASDLGGRMRPREGARYGLGLARFSTDCGAVIGHTGNLLGTITVVGARGDRLLVVAANVYPLEPPQEAALQRLLVRGLCG